MAKKLPPTLQAWNPTDAHVRQYRVISQEVFPVNAVGWGRVRQ